MKEWKRKWEQEMELWRKVKNTLRETISFLSNKASLLTKGVHKLLLNRCLVSQTRQALPSHRHSARHHQSFNHAHLQPISTLINSSTKDSRSHSVTARSRLA